MASTFEQYLSSLPIAESELLSREIRHGSRRWRNLLDRSDIEAAALSRHSRAHVERPDHGEGWLAYLAIVVRGAVNEAARQAAKERERKRRWYAETLSNVGHASPINPDLARLRAALSRLETRAIVVLTMIHIEGHDQSDVAHLLEIPRITVRRIEALGLLALRRSILQK